MARGGEKRVVVSGNGATWEGVNKIQGKMKKITYHIVEKITKVY